MIFPIGLGLKIWRLPIFTILLVTANIAFHFMSPMENYNNHIKNELPNEQLEKILGQLKLEYCKLHNLQNCDKSIKEDKSNNQKNKITFQEALNIIEIENKFSEKLTNKNTEIMSLPSYNKYIELIEKSKKSRLIAVKKDNLPALGNLNLFSLFKAQFTHQNIEHLLGNLIIIIPFSIYIELRTSSLIFLLIYFVSGYFGLTVNLLFSDDYSIPIIGASANALGIMGAFYIFFLKSKMKLLFIIFPIFMRQFEFKTKTWLPVIYIGNEIIGMIINQGNVAHDAHLVGFSFGAMLAFLAKTQEKFKFPFIYTHEYELAKNADGKIDNFKKILEMNPNNIIISHSLLKAQLKLIKTNKNILFEKSFEQSINQMILYYFKISDWKSINKVLLWIPFDVNIQSFFYDFNQKEIIKLGDQFVKNNNLIMAIRIYQLYCMKFPKSKNVLDIYKTNTTILENLEYNESNVQIILQMVRIKPECFLNDQLSNWVQNNSYQVAS